MNELLDSVSIARLANLPALASRPLARPVPEQPVRRRKFPLLQPTSCAASRKCSPAGSAVVTTIDGDLGEALGKLYVEKHFPPAAKKRMDELVKNLMVAYRERIESRDWMGPETKKLALGKLAAVLPKIGYPEQVARLFRSRSRHRFLRRQRDARRGASKPATTCRSSASRSIASNGT